MIDLINEAIGAVFIAAFLILAVVSAAQIPNLPSDKE